MRKNEKCIMDVHWPGKREIKVEYENGDIVKYPYNEKKYKELLKKGIFQNQQEMHKHQSIGEKLRKEFIQI